MRPHGDWGKMGRVVHMVIPLAVLKPYTLKGYQPHHVVVHMIIPLAVLKQCLPCQSYSLFFVVHMVIPLAVLERPIIRRGFLLIQ